MTVGEQSLRGGLKQKNIYINRQNAEVAVEEIESDVQDREPY
jgi:hypothetical protein